jgi:3-oxoacyl-[acyl-carrier protein] reductase
MLCQNKAAIVTGSAQGIGKAIALKLAQEGAHLLIADKNFQGAQTVAKEISLLGRKSFPLQMDVTKKDQANNMVQEALKQFGRLDFLVNNAGIIRDSTLLKMTEEHWDEVINVNLKGVFLCTQAAAKVMKEQKYGRIVNIASGVLAGNFGQSNYVASKNGVVGLTKTAALELAKYGITVNVVQPGFIDSEMVRNLPPKVVEGAVAKIPVGRIGYPEDVANAVLLLVSDQADYINGAILPVTGGWLGVF